MINPDRIIKSIGIDIDSKNRELLKTTQNNASLYGMIQTTNSKNGYHIVITLNTPVKLKESLWIRFNLGDDPLRLLFDCLRIISNEDNLDILWDVKEKKQLNTIMENLR